MKNVIIIKIYFQDSSSDEGKGGVLQVTGYLRGRSLSVNGLVHITGYNDYQLIKV